MVRGGHMFAPTKTWRRWHRKVNIKNKRYAVCSALAASAVPALVMARGHRVEKLNEVPVVVSNAAESIKKTKDAMALLKAVGALPDVEKVRRAGERRSAIRQRYGDAEGAGTGAVTIGFTQLTTSAPMKSTHPSNTHVLPVRALPPIAHLARILSLPPPRPLPSHTAPGTARSASTPRRSARVRASGGTGAT